MKTIRVSIAFSIWVMVFFSFHTVVGQTFYRQNYDASVSVPVSSSNADTTTFSGLYIENVSTTNSIITVAPGYGGTGRAMETIRTVVFPGGSPSNAFGFKNLPTASDTVVLTFRFRVLNGYSSSDKTTIAVLSRSDLSTAGIGASDWVGQITIGYATGGVNNSNMTNNIIDGSFRTGTNNFTTFASVSSVDLTSYVTVKFEYYKSVSGVSARLTVNSTVTPVQQINLPASSVKSFLVGQTANTAAAIGNIDFDDVLCQKPIQQTVPSDNIVFTINPTPNGSMLAQPAFSITPDQISSQLSNLSNPTFQQKTGFGKAVRLALTAGLSPAQQAQVVSTIQYSIANKREVILLLDSSITPTNVASQLAFLSSFFSTGAVKWFELGNEVWDYWTLPFTAIVDRYKDSVLAYIPKIKAFQPNAKFIVCSIEGSYAFDNTWTNGCPWTERLLSGLGSPTPINAIAIHLYPDRSDQIALSPFRRLSTGYAVKNGYKTAFTKNYPTYADSLKLTSLLRSIINGRAIDVYCTEYSLRVLSSTLRKGMENALVFANTLGYFSNENVRLFAVHQLGKDSSNILPEGAIGFNVVNNANNLLPFGFAVKMLSDMKPQMLTVSASPLPSRFLFNTSGTAMVMPSAQDTIGSLDQAQNIPYLTAFASRSGDSITVAVVNMSGDTTSVSLQTPGFTPLSQVRNTMQSTSLLGNNDVSEVISPSGYISVGSLNNIKIPAYSISVFVLNAGISDVKDERRQASAFKLEQNYPNPFNPTTSIRYSVPSLAEVELRVFDVLGREVAMLVREKKPAGNYEVRFDASHFASGMYFYQLKAGGFLMVKKMLLIK